MSIEELAQQADSIYYLFKSRILLFGQHFQLEDDLSFKTITFGVLYGLSLFSLYKIILSPVSYLSKTKPQIVNGYFTHLIISVMAKVILILLNLILCGIYLPLITGIEYLLMKLFGLNSPLNSHESILIIFWINFGFSCLLILWDEFKISNQLKVIPREVIHRLNDKHKLEIPEHLINHTFFYTRDHLPGNAYTYGDLFIRPRIVFSRAMLMPSWEKKFVSILIHEFAHVRRFDNFLLLAFSTFDRLFRLILKVMFTICNFISNIHSVLNKIMIPFRFIIGLFEGIWIRVRALQVFSARLSETIADTEASLSASPSSLISSFANIQAGVYISSRNRPLEKESEFYVQKQIQHHQQDLSNKSSWDELLEEASKSIQCETHPDFHKRSTWSANFSNFHFLTEKNRFLLKLINPKWPGTILKSLIGITLVILIGNQIYQTLNFKRESKEYLEYVNYLETGEHPILEKKEVQHEDNRR